MRLKDKICLVTGAGSGIGKAIARLFAEEGGKVAVADIDGDSARAVTGEIEKAGGAALAVTADVSDGGSVQAMLKAVMDAHGRIDVLVNNAGFGIKATVEETSEEDWERINRVNLGGVFLGCKYVIPLMRKGGGGVIVNNASVTAIMGIRDRAAYCATKGGVAALTRAMAIDHWPDGIRVNAIGAGTIETPYHKAMFDASSDPAGLRREFEQRHVMDRMGTPEELAKAFLFLACDDSSFCTGSLLIVDGGMSVW